MELIKVTEKNGKQLVSARELYEYFELAERFSRWFERMVEYGLNLNTDYTLYQNVHPKNNQQFIDYALTLDAAKEISMLQRSEKGKQARQYFIECEKRLKTTYQLPQTYSQALLLASQQAEQIEKQEAQLRLNAPKVLFADAVSASKTSILIGELAKLLKQNKVDFGQNRLFDWLRRNGYLISREGTDYNMPTQRSMEMGLFEIKETSVMHSDGHVSVSKTSKVTGKGQLYFINKFLNPTEQKQKIS
ncbi:phage antirepressor KilAC domain-containing protein [Polluticaenibacter yanchengensis]|uniref:Phage antirepressor KilAC domain-containing protein n=1 Tax=Polluticaenibacter yanchengensis TaxID=3014562 RepID=A0ABT4UIM0_9BACT|nr:phage antirepressor KilAC domain-containing protein [Chitinophagaceae bacterium LY-5]